MLFNFPPKYTYNMILPVTKYAVEIKLLIISVFLIPISFLSCSKVNNQKIDIIPEPLTTEISDGYFTLQQENIIHVNSTNQTVQNTAHYLIAKLSKSTGLSFTTDNNLESNSGIILKLNEALDSLGQEGYVLKVERDKIVITAFKANGLFYGIQSLLQLFPPEVEANTVQQSEWKIPVVRLTDKPRFAYRGMHLDVSRHFFSVKDIKKYIDLLAMNKINVFHWHLTDDQGWRIEIKKHPKLTEVGAWRVERTEIWDERPEAKEGEKATYGGFYTQKEIKELVAYAAGRFIEVIPEIDMPGHMVAVLASYPQYACDNETYRVIPGGYWPPRDILCVGNDSSLMFIKDVLSEVMELFPSKYVHIGGDEAVKTKWETCPKCQNRMKQHSLTTENELQSWFIAEIEKFVLAHNKRIIGWDEILEGGLAPEATVMSWRGTEGGIEAAKMGHDVIMTPYSHLYLDYAQDNPETEPKAMNNNLTTLQRVYSYEPMPAELTKDEQKYILGAQANVWTEFMPDYKHVEYMASSRMCALAELAWSFPENRNYDNFRRKMEDRWKRYDVMGVNYSRGSTIVDIRFDEEKNEEENKSVVVSLSTDYINTVIYYTLNGAEPDQNSLLYTEPFKMDKPIKVKAVLVQKQKILPNSLTAKSLE